MNTQCHSLLLLVALATCATTVHASFVDIGAGLTGVQGGCGAWADYDRDGDLDLALVGKSVAGPFGRVYRNDGGSTFTAGPSLPVMQTGQLAWGDYDADGDPDLAITGYTGAASITLVLRNDWVAGVPEAFTTAATLEGLNESAPAWADYDNDGDLDLAVAGWTGAEAVTRVYRNDGNDTFVDAVLGLTGVRRGSLAWCDEDLDGDADLVVAGATTTGALSTTLYLNNGALGLVPAPSVLPGVSLCAVRWTDFDLDGDPDLLIDGSTAMTQIGRLYRNRGGTLTDAGISLQGMRCSATWGDMDGDGDPDLAMSGFSGSAGLTIVYTNTGSGMSATSTGLPGLTDACVAWGDFDADGRLDLFLSGLPSVVGSPIARIYHNTGTTPNTPPLPPAGLAMAVGPDSVTFQWTPATDAQAPAPALGYNLWVGRTGVAADVVSPMADLATGRRHVVAPGNVGQRLSWTIARRALPTATVSWGVQAIDASYDGSAFASRLADPLPVAFPAAPRDLALRVAGANPFHGSVRFACTLERAGDVRVAVTDVGGRLVRPLAAGPWPAGVRELRWDGTRLDGGPAAPGVYFVRLDAGGASRSVRVLKLR